MKQTSPRHIIHQRIFYFLCLALVFMMPVYKRMIPYIIGLIVLNWLIDGSFISRFRMIFKSRQRWMTLSFSIIYLIYILGMIWSRNVSYGWFDLEIKLSLLVFPLVFATLDEDEITRTRTSFLLKSFVAGCLAGSIILLGHSFVMDRYYGLKDSFVYENLSWSFHPSYIGMYLIFAIAIILDYLFFHFPAMKKWYRTGLIVLVCYFIIVIFLLSSKAGIGSLILTIFFYIFLVFYKRKQVRTGLYLVIIVILIFGACFTLFPFVTSRIATTSKVTMMDENTIRNQGSSTAERIIIWKTSLRIIREHLLTGVGTGDVKDALLEKYKEMNLDKIFSQKLNAHNQYFQILIALGIFGLLILLSMFIIPAIIAKRNEDYLYLAFLMIWVFNLFFESMFETQAGVVFYGFFNVFLFVSSSNRANSSDR